MELKDIRTSVDSSRRTSFDGGIRITVDGIDAGKVGK